MKPLSVINLLTIALFSLLLTACSSASQVTGGTSSNLAPGSINGPACEKLGGKWVRGGILRFYGCLRPAKDAGKSCTDSQQCQYNCNASPGTSPRPGQAATGQCQANNSYTGCKIEIKAGVAKPAYCVKI